MIRRVTSSAPGVLPTLTFALLARVPVGALGLLIVLAVTGRGYSYAMAGIAIACCALSVSISAPVLGRLSDRIGQSPVLFGTGIASFVSLGAFVLVDNETPGWIFLLLAGLSGLTQPPVPACARAVWRRKYPTDVFDRVVTMDAALQEAAFVVGPIALVPLAVFTSPEIALGVVGVLSGGSALAFAALPEARNESKQKQAGHQSFWGPLVHPGVLTLTLLSAAVGTGFGATELGIVRTADAFDAESYSGLLFASLGLGSLMGGLLAVKFETGNPKLRMVALLTFLAVAILLLALATNLLMLGGLLLLTGLAIAPVFGIMYALIGVNSPKAMLTEAFSLATSGITVGLAIGNALAGISGTISEDGPFFVSAGAIVVAIVLISLRAKTMHVKEHALLPVA